MGGINSILSYKIRKLIIFSLIKLQENGTHDRFVKLQIKKAKAIS